MEKVQIIGGQINGITLYLGKIKCRVPEYALCLSSVKPENLLRQRRLNPRQTSRVKPVFLDIHDVLEGVSKHRRPEYLYL